LVVFMGWLPPAIGVAGTGGKRLAGLDGYIQHNTLNGAGHVYC
jgi:hypothetical protein